MVGQEIMLKHQKSYEEKEEKWEVNGAGGSEW